MGNNETTVARFWLAGKNTRATASLAQENTFRTFMEYYKARLDVTSAAICEPLTPIGFPTSKPKNRHPHKKDGPPQGGLLKARSLALCLGFLAAKARPAIDFGRLRPASPSPPEFKFQAVCRLGKSSLPQKRVPKVQPIAKDSKKSAKVKG